MLLTTSIIILSYLNCILAGLDDRKGEEAIGYIDNNAHTSKNTDGNSMLQLRIVYWESLIISSWFIVADWVHLIDIDLQTSTAYVDVCGPLVSSLLPRSVSARN